MTPLVIAWLLLVGALFGVMATLAYQWWGDRRPRVELDDYTARLRALDRQPEDTWPNGSPRRIPW